MKKMFLFPLLLTLIAACGQQEEAVVDPETGEVTFGD